MSNVATVSFKIAPDRYAILKALATSQGLTVSQFLRQTVEDALDLEQQVERLVDFLGAARPRGCRRWSGSGRAGCRGGCSRCWGRLQGPASRWWRWTWRGG